MDININELKQQFWDATNYGLRFFEDEFASEIARNQGRIKGFAVRSNDDTGSCHIHQKDNNPFTFTDFGVSNKGINAFDYVMERDKCDFWNAVKKLFSQYGIPLPQGQKIEPKIDFSSDVSEDFGHWEVDFFETIKNRKLVERLFPFYNDSLLNDYDFKEIKSYVEVGKSEKGKYKKTTTATDDFPIFSYDRGEFVKIYQPYASKGDKFIHKHSFIGKKSGKRIIYGWERLFKKVDYNCIKELHQYLANSTGSRRVEIQEELDNLKLDTVIIATGGTDGINIASLGYDVIWFNSETEVISSDEYYELSKITKNIYYVPDLDETGVKQAVEVAEKCLEIKIVWLPRELLLQGKKDFADWIRSEKLKGRDVIGALFKKMLGQALNFRFWDFSDKGNVRINSLKMLHFLQYHNFFTYKSPYLSKEKDSEGEFVFLKNNKITKVEPSDVKRFVREWAMKRFIDTAVQEKIISAPVFNITQLKMLPIFEEQQKNNSRHHQWYFFENKAVKITKDSISTVDFSKKLNINVWDREFIKHKFELGEPFFEIYKDAQNRNRIKITRKESDYLKVLINTSRMFWQKDADTAGKDTNPFGISSPNLTDEENYLQELHLLNKMYCVGYLLHQYKSENRALMIFGTDYKGGASTRGSYGGTGKTFLIKGLFHFLTKKEVDGKTFDKNNFPFDGVTEKTKLVLIDDLLPHQRMEDFFNKVTGAFEANHKGGAIYSIPFDVSPKLVATTNFVPNMEDGSSSRRMLIYQNSDYYHQKSQGNDYPFTRKISDDFGGRNIMSKESTPEEWNADFNFMLQCLQFYLSQDNLVEAPLDSLMERRHLVKVGDAFIAFFKDYFADNQNLDRWIENKLLIEEAQELFGKSKYSAQEINKKLTDYCAACGWSVEKKKLKNSLNNSVNHFYVNTQNTVAEPPQVEINTDLFNATDENIDTSGIAF